MSIESTASDALNPAIWDARLDLAFLENPAFETFSEWIDGELATLEARWRHTSSPNILQCGRVHHRRRASKSR